MSEDTDVVTFGSSEGRGHEELQAWRRANPRGFVLQRKPKAESVLHRADRCPHLGDSSWTEGRVGWRTLGHALKACSNSEASLKQWLIEVKKQTGAYRYCESCRPFTPPNPT